MKSKVSKRSDREIIVMSLSLTYALCVSVFAAIRLINEDWVIGILDVILAAFGMYVFIHVWRTRNSQLPAYAYFGLERTRTNLLGLSISGVGFLLITE